jgi:Xaa-Pro aminopeptidase
LESLPKDTPEERREAIFRLLELENKSVESVLISDPKHVFYFSGFSTNRPRHSGFLLLRRDHEPMIFMGESAAERARRSFHGRITTFEDYKLDERMVAYGDYVSGVLGKFIRSQKISKGQGLVGIEGWHLPAGHRTALGSPKVLAGRLLDISESILKMRKTKGRDELEFEREASKRLQAAYRTIRRHAFPGETELGLYAEANAKVFRGFGDLEYFEVSNVFGDYASGRRTLGGGGGPTGRRLRRGDLLILDLQASSRHHWVDACRTYLVGESSPTPMQERVFRTIVQAKNRAESMLKPGTKSSEIFKVVSRTIVDAGFRPLSHHAGHGLGLDDQEPPFFLPRSNEVLEEGVVCAVEPGIYDRSFGGMRVEDDYVITKDGFEKISRIPLGFP